MVHGAVSMCNVRTSWRSRLVLGLIMHQMATVIGHADLKVPQDFPSLPFPSLPFGVVLHFSFSHRTSTVSNRGLLQLLHVSAQSHH